MSAQHTPSPAANALSALAATALALASFAMGSPDAQAADNDPDGKAAETLILDLLTGQIAKADAPPSADNAQKTAPGSIELQVVDILADAAEQRRQADNPQPPDPFALPDREEANDAAQWLVDLIKAVVLQEDNHEVENAPEDLDLVNVILGANEARAPDPRHPRARKLGKGVRQLLLFISLLGAEGANAGWYLANWACARFADCYMSAYSHKFARQREYADFLGKLYAEVYPEMKKPEYDFYIRPPKGK